MIFVLLLLSKPVVAADLGSSNKCVISDTVGVDVLRYTPVTLDLARFVDAVNNSENGELLTSEVVATPTVAGSNSLETDDIHWHWSGWTFIETSGRVPVSITSDDYSFLLIDSEYILDNGGNHGSETVSGSVYLSRGWHRVDILYGENGGAADLSWSGLGSDQWVPTSAQRIVQGCVLRGREMPGGPKATGIDSTLAFQSDPGLYSPAPGSRLGSAGVDIRQCDIGTLQVDAGQDINDNGPINTTIESLDSGWSMSGNGELSYSGSPELVRLAAHVHNEIPGNVNVQRAAPAVELSRNGQLLTTAATGYIRDASNHEESSNTIYFVDHDPGVDPVYSIASLRESTIGADVFSTSGQFTGIACRSVTVLTNASSGETDTTDELSPSLSASNGELVFFNFSDQFNRFRAQIGNRTNAPLNWQMFVENVPYSDIPNIDASAPYTLESQANADGTFTYLFTGSTRIPAFGNITIAGFPISPPGNNTGASLYFSS